jgi:hypothetical protein
MSKIFYKSSELVQVTKDKEGVDKRRKLLVVTFNDGSEWYPKNDDLTAIKDMYTELIKHNSQYHDPEKRGVW